MIPQSLQTRLDAISSENGYGLEIREAMRKAAVAAIDEFCAPDAITDEPHQDYDCLKKQFFALRTLANSLSKTASFLRQDSQRLTREMLLVKGGIIDCERNTNEMLTEQLLKVEEERDQLRKALEYVVNVHCVDDYHAGEKRKEIVARYIAAAMKVVEANNLEACES